MNSKERAKEVAAKYDLDDDLIITSMALAFNDAQSSMLDKLYALTRYDCGCSYDVPYKHEERLGDFVKFDDLLKAIRG